MRSWWMSFADTKKFNGAVICDGDTEKEALNRVNQLGINPGGEVMFVELADDAEDLQLGKDRLITETELRSLNYKKLKDFTPEQQLLSETLVSYACNPCNPGDQDGTHQDA